MFYYYVELTDEHQQTNQLVEQMSAEIQSLRQSNSRVRQVCRVCSHLFHCYRFTANGREQCRGF
jgi:hypothetical protein